MIPTLLLPGLGDSGLEHWQSHWERHISSCQRVVQAEWDAPHREHWEARLDAAILGASEPVVLVGHGSSCLLVAHWAVHSKPRRLARVRGALLVAPADPDGPHYPTAPRGFGPVPLVRLPFPTIVVASDNDPGITAERAREFALKWGSRYVEVAGAGHIDEAAGYGPWPAGYALLQALRAAPLPDEFIPWWLASEAELDAFLVAFREGTFPIAWWTHGAHVAMAATTLWDTPVTVALSAICGWIKHYNVAQGGQNTGTSGYHETLTRLWIAAVAALLCEMKPETVRLEVVRRAYGEFARQSGYFREWYSFDLLTSTAARKEWVAPDRMRRKSAADNL